MRTARAAESLSLRASDRDVRGFPLEFAVVFLSDAEVVASPPGCSSASALANFSIGPSNGSGAGRLWRRHSQVELKVLRSEGRLI